MTKQTRQRELARLRARREAERRHTQRRRALWTYSALGVVVLLLGTVGAVLLANKPKHKAAAATTTTTPPTTAVTPTGARIDAPSAPAAVACGAKLPPRHKHPTFKEAPTSRLDPAKTYVVTLKTSCGVIKVQMDPKTAPIAAANFVFLAQHGFYDSTWFHRILPGGTSGLSVLQGGDPQGTGQGGPGYTIKDEPPKGIKTPYKKDTIAMAKTSQPNSAGSQFFINSADNASLPADYALFGKVISGQSAVDKIAAIPVAGANGDTPQQSAWIEQATVQVS
jgi:peptidyl-prolyl cis-trans isomerase B (cyclophilin B)